MQTLRSQAGMSAQALEFTILTAARSGEVGGARWAEIDLDAATWTVPGDRMKAGKEHRVPLSDAALAIVNALPHEDRNALVFGSPRGGTLSDMSLTAVLRRMKVDARMAFAPASGTGAPNARTIPAKWPKWPWHMPSAQGGSCVSARP